jgi:hypothetical protein
LPPFATSTNALVKNDLLKNGNFDYISLEKSNTAAKYRIETIIRLANDLLPLATQGEKYN